MHGRSSVQEFATAVHQCFVDHMICLLAAKKGGDMIYPNSYYAAFFTAGAEMEPGALKGRCTVCVCVGGGEVRERGGHSPAQSTIPASYSSVNKHTFASDGIHFPFTHSFSIENISLKSKGQD